MGIRDSFLSIEPPNRGLVLNVQRFRQAQLGTPEPTVFWVNLISRHQELTARWLRQLRRVLTARASLRHRSANQRHLHAHRFAKRTMRTWPA